MIAWDPDATLPVGFGEPRFERFVAGRLDDHFADQAERRMAWCLEGCRAVMDGAEGRPPALDEAAGELAYALAQAAAHWRRVADDRRAGAAMAAEEDR